MMRSKTQAGFSLIEMIVSLGLFAVVITIAMGALLTLIATNKELQAEQSVMTNLSFALDSMTREIRTGTAYFCESKANDTGSPNIFNDDNNIDEEIGDDTQNCPTGRPSGGSGRFHGISFKEAGDSITGAAERILYYYNENDGKLYRRVGADPAQSIVSSGIYIQDANFFVTGSAPQSNSDNYQALVTIYIEAKENNNDPEAKVYKIQTTVTQKTLDI